MKSAALFIIIFILLSGCSNQVAVTNEDPSQLIRLNQVGFYPEALKEFVDRAVADLAAGYGGIMVSLGDKLGLYRAMAGAWPYPARTTATRTYGSTTSGAASRRA